MQNFSIVNVLIAHFLFYLLFNWFAIPNAPSLFVFKLCKYPISFISRILIAYRLFWLGVYSTNGLLNAIVSSSLSFRSFHIYVHALIHVSSFTKSVCVSSKSLSSKMDTLAVRSFYHLKSQSFKASLTKLLTVKKLKKIWHLNFRFLILDRVKGNAFLCRAQKLVSHKVQSKCNLWPRSAKESLPSNGLCCNWAVPLRVSDDLLSVTNRISNRIQKGPISHSLASQSLFSYKLNLGTHTFAYWPLHCLPVLCSLCKSNICPTA